MINSINTLGLKPESIFPEKYKSNVSINAEVSIYFNSNLDASSIIGNLYILEDSKLKYSDDISNFKLEDYKIVDGNLTYKDKTIIFTPREQLNMDARYIIYMPSNGIRDVIGNLIQVDFISYFTTEGVKSVRKCDVVYPVSNSILTSLDKIVVSDVDSEKYLLQISKVKTFDNLIHEEIVDSTTISKNFNLGDGLYFIRAKAINGDFGEISVLTIKTHENTIPTDQDLDEDYIWQEYEEEEHSIIETFPLNNAIGINEKTNILYMKLKGIVELEDIDFYESFLVGESNDDDINITSHEQVDGSFTVVHDEEKLETYVIFTPISL